MAHKEFILADDLVILSTSDLSGNIVDYNSAFRYVSGYEDSELMGKSHSILRHPDMPKSIYHDLWTTIQAGKPWFGVIKNRRKNGDFYWVNANVTPIIEQKKILGYLSVRYPASRSQALYAGALYADIQQGKANLPLSVTPTVSTKPLIVISSFLASLPILQSTLLPLASMEMPWYLSTVSLLASLAGLSYLTYQALAQVQPSQTLVRAVEDIANGQFRQPVRDTSYWGNALNMIRSRLGEAYARLYDTIEKETKARLLVELAREQTLFLSNMSHELRTPLMGMMNTSQQLLQDLSGSSHRQQAQMLHASSHQLSNVIYNLLDYACLETGQLRLKPNDFRVQNWLCAEVLLTHLQSIKDKGLGYKLIVKAGVPVMLHSDQVRLSQVLNNLLSNAVKFTDKGEIVVTLERGEAYHNQLVELKIRVSDTGCGLSRQQLSRLFMPFSTQNQSESTQSKGAGLGLVVSNQLVQMMQGEITVHSQQEKGTVVEVSLLLPQVGEELLPKITRDMLMVVDQDCGIKASLEKPFQGMRIAIVEDNLINQAVIISLLKKLGIDQVSVFNHGRDFIESADQNIAFDLVLIDCLMPVMDGYETTRQWRKLERERKRQDEHPLPIIALTANAVMGDEDACYSAGMNDYLTKPVSLEMLRSCLLRHWHTS